MTSRRPKVEPIRHPTLFEMDRLEQAGNLANSVNVERPYGETGLLLIDRAIQERSPQVSPLRSRLRIVLN